LQLIYHDAGNVIEAHEHAGDFKNSEAIIGLEVWKFLPLNPGTRIGLGMTRIHRARTLQRTVVVALLLASAGASAAPTDHSAIIPLPKPDMAGSMALEQALASRRSIREFAKAPLSAAEIGQLLWATQGVTDTVRGFRVAPSAGALYPLELYVANEDGLFRYVPQRHALIKVQSGDSRPAIATAAHGQAVVREAPVLVVITAVVGRTRAKYGSRAERYVTLEAGHAAQGLLLEGTALKLGATVVGAFDDNALRAVVGANKGELPLYVVAVGRPRGP
jgi:SagB-type dehydrogenase family enzyme